MATLSQHHNIHQSPHQQQSPLMPHGLGLLTTVASLPPKYRSRYLNIKAKVEIPLDLSVKQSICADDERMTTTPITLLSAPTILSSSPPPVPGETLSIIHKPITPPLTPPKRRKYFEEFTETESIQIANEIETNSKKLLKTTEVHLTTTTTSDVVTPTKPSNKNDSSPPKTNKTQPPTPKPSKNKATRKLKFDEDTSSPVSGTIIRPLEEITDGTVQYSNGDIDPKYNIVEATDETKAELAAIRNVIGDYVCKLCRIKFDDAFGLARHRCSCIVLLEYRCPECGKQFNCPANLASHRRWHKPKTQGMLIKKENRNHQQQSSSMRSSSLSSSLSSFTTTTPPPEDNPFECDECGKKFRRQAYLRKHKLIHKKEMKSTTARAAAAATAAGTAATATESIGSNSSSIRSQSQTGSVSSHSRSPQSYNGHDESESVYTFDYDTMSECSSSSTGRLQIVESSLTEEENIAAAALTNLRNCTSVIQHTTVAH